MGWAVVDGGRREAPHDFDSLLVYLDRWVELGHAPERAAERRHYLPRPAGFAFVRGVVAALPHVLVGLGTGWEAVPPGMVAVIAPPLPCRRFVPFRFIVDGDGTADLFVVRDISADGERLWEGPAVATLFRPLVSAPVVLHARLVYAGLAIVVQNIGKTPARFEGALLGHAVSRAGRVL